MTQIFDPETGVVTPVTVIEAGPCPVVEVKTPDAARLRGRAARVRAGRRVRKLSKPEIGHLKKNGVEPHRHLVEFRGPSEAVVGETVTVEAFEPGDKVKVSGISHRQGLPGNDQAPQLPPRPGLARLAQRPQAGLDRRVGDAVARLQGHQDGRPMGGKRRTQVGLVVHSVDAERNLLLVKGAVPGPEERAARDQGGQVAWQVVSAPLLDARRARSRRTSSSRRRLRRRGQAAPRARDRARGAERRSARERAARSRAGSSPAAARSRGARRAPAARAPARSARRSSPAAASSSRRRCASFEVKVNKKARHAALRSALSDHAAHGTLARRSATTSFTEPSTTAAAALARRVGPGAAAARRSRARGRGDADQVVPQPREDPRHRSRRARRPSQSCGRARCSSPRAR